MSETGIQVPVEMCWRCSLPITEEGRGLDLLTFGGAHREDHCMRLLRARIVDLEHKISAHILGRARAQSVEEALLEVAQIPCFHVSSGVEYACSQMWPDEQGRWCPSCRVRRLRKTGKEGVVKHV